MDSNKLQDFFNKASGQKVLIIGDVMLDAYLWGRADRISPEAPVPVVHIKETEYRLGGAANVARNIKALGADPILVSLIGEDDQAQIIKNLLNESGISSEGLIASSYRPTTVKNRIFSHNQQMIRYDYENSSPLFESELKDCFDKISQIINNIDVIVFQDYDKGTLNSDLISKVIALGRSKNIPITVDPKKRNFLAYKGVSLFKPNLKEIREGLNIEINPDDLNEVNNAAEELISVTGSEVVFITLSSKGIFVKSKEKQQLIPAFSRSVADVSGAGDTVISIASLCIAQNMDLIDTANLANIAASLVCQEVGVVPIDKEKLQQVLLK